AGPGPVARPAPAAVRQLGEVARVPEGDAGRAEAAFPDNPPGEIRLKAAVSSLSMPERAELACHLLRRLEPAEDGAAVRAPRSSATCRPVLTTVAPPRRRLRLALPDRRRPRPPRSRCPVALRASVGSTEASESLLVRVGVVGPKRATTW